MTISLQRETEFCVTLQWAGINTQIHTAGIDLMNVLCDDVSKMLADVPFFSFLQVIPHY